MSLCLQEGPAGAGQRDKAQGGAMSHRGLGQAGQLHCLAAGHMVAQLPGMLRHPHSLRRGTARPGH